jgi:hypothetical protein
MANARDYLRRLDPSDVTENRAGGARVKNLAEKIAAIGAPRTRCTEILAELDKTGESQILLTDPDSRVMAAHTHVAVGYNIQVAVDTKHKLIAGQQVTNQVVDMGLLTQTAASAKEVRNRTVRFHPDRESRHVLPGRQSRGHLLEIDQNGLMAVADSHPCTIHAVGGRSVHKTLNSNEN